MPDLRSRAAPIIENAPLPIVEVQGSTHVVCYVNSAFCSLVGKTRGELLGNSFAAIVPGGDKCVPVLDGIYHTGEAATHAQEDDSEPNSSYWLYAMWPVLDANKGPVGAIVQLTKTAHFRQNVTAINEQLVISAMRQHALTEAAQRSNDHLQAEIAVRKQAEEALHTAKDQLAKQATSLEHLVSERTAELTAANNQLQTFVYSIAHDLRAPLRAMQGFSVMLVEEAGSALSETCQDFARRISKSSQFMDALLMDLLAFSRVSQQRIALVPVNLESIVHDTLSRFEKEIQEKNAQVEILGPWSTVLAHAPTLGQVLFNLVSNAFKFVAPDVKPVLRFRAEERGGLCRVWVEDNGIGIAREYQQEVFGLFNRLHGEAYPGTGIGLTIVQKGIERMGGHVGLESTPGAGSRFWFELRRA